MRKRFKEIGKIEEYFLTLKRGEIYDRAIEDIDKVLIEKALEKSSGNQVQAAKLLGINRNTLHSKIKKIDIDVARYKYK